MSNQSHRRDEPEDNSSNAPSGENLGGLLGALLGGLAEAETPPHTTPQRHVPPAAPNANDEVLGRLSDTPMMEQGGAAPSTTPTQGTDMGDVLGGMMGNAGGQGGDLGSLLGGLLGGLGGAQGGMGQTGADSPMGDILGSLLGGGGGNTAGGQGGDPLGGLLGGLFGGQAGMGASSNMGGLSSMLSPLADALAEKTGIPRDVALSAMSIIIPMVINKLMSSSQGGGSDVLGSLSSGSIPQQGLSFSSNEKHEMVQQLTAQTGLDHHAATTTLNQALQVLGSQP